MKLCWVLICQQNSVFPTQNVEKESFYNVFIGCTVNGTDVVSGIGSFVSNKISF